MNRVTIAILLLGVGLRTVAFASERSLWIDEAMVALNIVERSPARLFEPLDRNQGAPVGFLLATKASVELFGPTERALRLPAYLASLVGLGAFAIAAYRLLPHPSGHLAFALFAVSPHVVAYAAECKQYSSDAAFAAVLLALAAGRWNLRRGIVFAIVGALSVWCSHPALFVLSGLGIALLANAILQRDRSRILGLISLGGVWLLSFAAVYFVNLRHLGHNDYLIRYWSGHFAPGLHPIWYIDHALAFVDEPAGMAGESRAAQAALGIVAVLGMAAIGRRSFANVSLAFLVTFAIALLASHLRLYPFAGRLLLFLVPMVCLIWAGGAVWLAARLSRQGHWLAWLVVIWPLFQSVEALRHPARAEEIRPLLNHVKANWRDGDRVYVYGGSGDAGAGPAFDFYSPRYDFPADRVIRGGVYRDDPEQYRVEVAKLPHSRTWILFTHRHRDEESVILAAFAERGSVKAALLVPGGSLHLYSPP